MSSLLLPVVVHQPNVVGIVTLPAEDESPLVIHANRMQPLESPLVIAITVTV